MLSLLNLKRPFILNSQDNLNKELLLTSLNNKSQDNNYIYYYLIMNLSVLNILIPKLLYYLF